MFTATYDVPPTDTGVASAMVNTMPSSPTDAGIGELRAAIAPVAPGARRRA